MEDVITTYEEYQECLKAKKEIRNELFNLKIDMFMSKNDIEKTRLLEEKNKIIRKKFAKLAYKIKKYEVENNIEVKKEGRKK